MNVRVEQAGPCRRDVHIEIPADDVAKEFNEVVEAYGKFARVPGFRPGKAPRELVVRRFGKDIKQEVKDRLVPKAYQEAVKANNLQAVTVLDVKEETLETGRPFAFTVQLDVAPEFNLPVYKGIEIQAKAVELKEEDVESTITNLRNQAGRYSDVTGQPVRAGDLAQVDYEGTLDGQPVEGLAPKAAGIGQGKDFWVMADAENSFLPGFGEALVGGSIGETRTIPVTFPAGFTAEALAGKTASYQATIKGIRERQPAELNEEFFKTLRVESLDGLRDRVRSELKEMREAAEERRRRGEVIQYLLKNTALEVPESLLARETYQEVNEIVQQSQQRGMASDDLETRKEEIFEAATRSATEKVKLRYVLRKIAGEEKVEVSADEMDRQIKGLALQYRVPAEKLKADLASRNALGRVEDDIRLNKALDLLVAAASIKPA